VILDAERTERIESLAREIAGNATDAVILEYARSAAEAELDLAQVRQVKVAVIERMLACREPKTPEALESSNEIRRPLTEPERLADAVRRALPELVKLDRYERRAAAVRQRSIRSIRGRKTNLYS
jgi:hypothetical protein